LLRFAQNRSGASALEFAIIGVPLILLLLAIFEIAFIYMGNFSLENAVNQAARLVRTGQAQNFNAASFKQSVCEALLPPLSCEGLKLDVRTFDSFGSSELTSPVDGQGNMKQDFSFDPGARNDVVVVRAFYEWPLLKAFPAPIDFATPNNGSPVLIATAAFRNEPF
jgi:Flp pilus assembly protein TadG